MNLGDFPEDFTTVTCMFTTHAATGATVAPNSAFEAADVLIYKNGNAAQKTTTNGVTMSSPFDSIVGLHCVVIDTSNDTGDGGFWVAGAQYTLVLSPDETIDGMTTAKVIGTFGIELSEVLRPTTAGRQVDIDASGGVEVGSFQANAITAAAIAADVTTELQAGLATAAALSTAQASIDDLPTNAELATALTDLQVDVRKVKGITVNGSGTEVDPWGP